MAKIDYKDKYEKTVQAAMLAKQNTESAVTIGILEEIFPELKESEDELIRKEILSFCRDRAAKFSNDPKYVNIDKWIAWLEKQGEQKPTDFSDLRTWKYIVDAVWTEKEGIGQYLDSPFTEEVAKKLQKRFGNIEQKPDKVEPKFKVGDTVKDPYGDLYHITEIIDDSYKTDDGRFILFENQEVYTLSNFTAWSEEDDMVLNSILDSIQREGVLEKKRKTDWLKSLKDRVQPKQEWSEEDESKIRHLIAFLDTNPNSVIYSRPKEEWIDWLKSLRPQNRWKPSDEQMKALKEACDEHWESDGLDPLYTLYQNLKKLREE